MWKYVSRRVKDTIELGISVRKSFTIQQFDLNQNSNEKQQQHVRKQNQHHLNRLVPQIFDQDPSRDKNKGDEKFKRKYYRLNDGSRCFLNALTWSTAIITGFYSSQLLCLYRRNQRLRIDSNRCSYSKYLQNTTSSIHKNVKYLLTEEGQHAIVSSLPKFECPFKGRSRQNPQAKRTLRLKIEDEFLDFKHFVDPGYKQYERFFEASCQPRSKSNVYNVSNDTIKEPVKQPKNDGYHEPKQTETESEEDRENAAIDEAIHKLAHIVGELELQMGIESFTSGDFVEAVKHFKLSTNHKHPGGIFNLALCYEQGVGVPKNLKTAKRLYEIASELGHAKALYNLGVYAAQGWGGLRRSARQAKSYFKRAAELGSPDAAKALSLSLSSPIELPVMIEEFKVDEIFSSDKSMINSAIMNQNLQKMMQVAVS